MELPREYPFSRLVLPSGEGLLWHGSNPTFHRFDHYGIALTDVAFYWFRPAWILGKWRRIPLSDIQSVRFEDSRWRHRLVVKSKESTLKCKAPYDTYKDEVNFDRKVLTTAAELVSSRAGGIKVVASVT